MKKTRVFNAVGIIILLLVLVPAVKAGPPAGDWVTGIACQNMGTQTTTLTLKFYQENSNVEAASYADPTLVDPGKSRNYYTGSLPFSFPANFLGSAVVSAGQPLACTINTQTTGTGTTANFFRMSTSGGFDSTQVAPKIFVPQVEKNLSSTWNSYVAVQNATANPVPMTISYKDRYGVAYPSATMQFTIPGFSNKVFYQNDNANLPPGFLGGAVVSANDGTSDLAATVNLYNNGSSYKNAQISSYSGFNSGDSVLWLPRVVRKLSGYNSGISVQNIGDTGTVNVRITFYFTGLAAKTITAPAPINPGASWAIYLPDKSELVGVDSLPNNNRYGMAKVEIIAGGTGSGPIVANVNEGNRGGTGIPLTNTGHEATYNAILDGGKTHTVYFSQVVKRTGTGAIAQAFSGGFQVANASGAATTCDISYNGTNPVVKELGVSLGATGTIKRFLPDLASIPNGYNSSVTVACGQDVVGANWLAVTPAKTFYGDTLTMTGGINQ